MYHEYFYVYLQMYHEYVNQEILQLRHLKNVYDLQVMELVCRKFMTFFVVIIMLNIIFNIMFNIIICNFNFKLLYIVLCIYL
jgi:hypothetical protein